MVGSPKAQADRRAVIWRLDSDTDEAWTQVLDELVETDSLVVTKLEDGTAVLEWHPSEEGARVPREKGRSYRPTSRCNICTICQHHSEPSDAKRCGCVVFCLNHVEWRFLSYKTYGHISI
ncbi:TPA: DUF1654 domain-containing protein [Pseudomonas aeruginosa]